MPYSPLQRQRIEQSLCFECNRPALPGVLRCVFHRDKQKERNARSNPANYLKRKQAGICARCGRLPAHDGRVVCKSCAEHNDHCERSAQSKARSAAYVRRWRKDHPTYAREWGLARDPERKRELALRSNRKNRETVNARSRRQYARDTSDPARKLKVFARSQKRRTMKAGAKGSHAVKQWLARVDYYGWRCRWCLREVTLKTLTKDHVIPISGGGTDWASNLVPACKSCNSSKGAKRSYNPAA